MAATPFLITWNPPSQQIKGILWWAEHEIIMNVPPPPHCSHVFVLSVFLYIGSVLFLFLIPKIPKTSREAAAIFFRLLFNLKGGKKLKIHSIHFKYSQKKQLLSTFPACAWMFEQLQPRHAQLLAPTMRRTRESLSSFQASLCSASSGWVSVRSDYC